MKEQEQLMKEPDPHLYYHTTYKDARYSLMTGKQIINKFYDQDRWHTNHIPRELDEKKWVPEEDRYYRVWWDHTDPADPADSGYSYIEYIAYSDWVSREETLREKLTGKIRKVKDKDIQKVIDFINSL